jgi:LuxR family maltose regulon positive regulatory protein
MDTPLLATKLFIPPVPHNMVPRVKAVNRLDEGLRQGRRLTLITAPPGYGKTSLMASWVTSQHLQGERKFCWLALEESDNDPAQFWTYFLASLQTCQANLGASLAQSIWPQPNSAIVKLFLIGLVNEAANLEERLVIVLDDFHLIQNETILN